MDLDNPVWASLTGPHARFAERRGAAARYRPDLSPFAALADPADPHAWLDLAELVGPGAIAVLPGVDEAPEGWTTKASVPGVLMAGDGLAPAEDPEAVVLTDADVPEMLDLVARTDPGPFESRTIELGTYLGIRRDGRLVAMAGERLHPPGATEISAVCTDPDHRGQGLAARLVGAVAANIVRRGDVPFLHASARNTGAIRLYERLGFTLRRRRTFLVVETP